MIKKKAKGKNSKKGSKKKGSVKKQKELRPAEVRKNISLMVEENAPEMAQALIDVGKTGQVATVKYLLESAGIFPKPAAEGEHGSPEEDSLAKTLMRRLNLPEEPIDLDNPPVVEQKLLGSGDASDSDKPLAAENAEDDEKN